jgi:hypothetical protein
VFGGLAAGDVIRPWPGFINCLQRSPRAKRCRRRANWQVSAADYDGLIWREERLGACTAREAVVAHVCAETCNVHWLS